MKTQIEKEIEEIHVTQWANVSNSSMPLAEFRELATRKEILVNKLNRKRRSFVGRIKLAVNYLLWNIKKKKQ